jgi:predicted nucleotide-binding protein
MTSKLQNFIDEAEDFTEEHQIVRWQSRVCAFLEYAHGAENKYTFEYLALNIDNKFDQLANQLGYLDAIVHNEPTSSEVPQESLPFRNQTQRLTNRRVFVVHGHDNEAKEVTCRFIEKMGLEAVVLHEQPNEGKTIIEKLEHNADVAFAVILLTPDDRGASIADQENFRFRARQNVMLELGYFLARLGRDRVCALLKGNVEIPTDYRNVLHIEMDNDGGWKTKLFQELKSANIDIDTRALFS